MLSQHSKLDDKSLPCLQFSSRLGPYLTCFLNRRSLGESEPTMHAQINTDRALDAVLVFWTSFVSLNNTKN